MTSKFNMHYHSQFYFSLHTDMNECTQNPDICGDNSKCDNTDGNYTCTCEKGYRSDGAAGNREINSKGES